VSDGKSSANPWNAENERCYELNEESINNVGGRGLINATGSVALALLSAFPSQPWKLWKFPKPPRRYWMNDDVVRLFFNDFAQRKHILAPESWYKVTHIEIEKQGGASKF